MAKSASIYRREDFEAGVRAAWLDTAVRRTQSSGPFSSGEANGCEAAVACPRCAEELQSAAIDYQARSSAGNCYVKSIPGHLCPGCSTAFAYKLFADDLDEFVNSVPRDLQIIPEVGIQTSEGVEVFVSVFGGEAGPGFTCEVESGRIPGLRISVGAQSELFEKCLDQVTAYDTSDYGHDLSSTLRIEPGPPYDLDYRREIQVLLSRVRRSGAAVMTFWSLDFEPPWDDDASPLQKLSKILEASAFDEDRVCLALLNNIAAGVEPGRFVNTFRLLETAVNRALERRIRDARFDAKVDHTEFVQLVRYLQADLKTRLREAVKGKAGYPIFILKKVWRVLEPGKRYSQDEVFDRLTKLRNYSVHSPAGAGESIKLPWEVKPLGPIAEALLELVAFLADENATRTVK